jgi:hypothetical protein
MAATLDGHSIVLFITVDDLDAAEKAVAGAPVFKARHKDVLRQRGDLRHGAGRKHRGFRPDGIERRGPPIATSLPGHEWHGPYHDSEYGFPLSGDAELFEA